MLLDALGNLCGKRLSSTHSSSSFRVFQFGPLARRRKGWVGESALHIICPWRITVNGRIVTGSRDGRFNREGDLVLDWDQFTVQDSLQYRLLEEWLPRDPTKITVTKHGRIDLYAIDPSLNIIVEAATLGPIGDLQLDLSGGVRIDVMIDGTVWDQWRILNPRDLRRRHICVDGPGQIVMD